MKKAMPILLILLLILSVLIVFLVCILGPFVAVLKDFSKKTVVQTIPSPSGKYYAQVIDHDQGALGGNTIVEVYKKSNPKAKPQTIYDGEWGEYKTMEIYWEDDNCLVINGIQYKIENTGTLSGTCFFMMP